MESDGEDIENIFEEYENDDEAESTENKTANETPGAVKIAAPRRIVKNPRLKFNADRLCGERGIPVLVDHFKNVKFKGPGHEKEDLDRLLSKLEHWTHRLFPSMKFEDCLNHIERLGTKRPVKTCLNKIRLDMPILANDFVKDNEEDDVKRNDDEPEPEEIDAFDRLLGEQGETSNMDVSASDNFSNSSSFYSSPMLSDTTAHVLGSSFGSSLTEEQKERMERNKMLAAERRKARLAAMEQNSMRSQSETQDETVSENSRNDQNSFDMLLQSSQCNRENVETNKAALKTSDDYDRDLQNSSDLNNDNSGKLGLDDLMNLVDEEEPISEENGIVSVSEQIESPVNINEILSPKNLNLESLLDLVYETSEDANVIENADVSMNHNTVRDENYDLTVMDCENKDSENGSSNIKQITKFEADGIENIKDIDSVSQSTENEIPSSPKNEENCVGEALNVESALDLVSVVSNVNRNSGSPVKDDSNNIENVTVENESLTPMDCGEENS